MATTRSIKPSSALNHVTLSEELGLDEPMRLAIVATVAKTITDLTKLT